MVEAVLLALVVGQAELSPEDWLARFNAEALKVEEPAWPALRDAAIALLPTPEFARSFDKIMAGHSIDESRDWVEAHRDGIDRLVEAVQAPALGFVASYNDDEILSRALAEASGEAYEPVERPAGPTLQEVLLPHLGVMRNACRVLGLDAAVAAVDGDEARFVRDIDAILQMAEYSRENTTMIAELVSIAIVFEACTLVLHATKQELIVEKAEALQIVMAEAAEFDVSLEMEHVCFQSLLDGLYEDGDDGRITEEGFGILDRLTERETSPLVRALLQLVTSARRGTDEALYETWLAMARSFINADHWDRERPTPDEWSDELEVEDGGLVTLILVGQTERFAVSMTKLAGEVAGVRVLLDALEHKSEFGQWPDTLDVEALDPLTGESLRYLLTEDGPVVYSAGPDLDDDGGRPASRFWRWVSKPPPYEEEPPDGDWVIYPPQ